MSIAVVGGGPAGLAAALRLKRAGRDVVVLEREEVVGGRTRVVEPAPGHLINAGAGWIGSFYTRTLALCEGLDLVEVPMRTSPTLLVDRRRVAAPLTAPALVISPLLPLRERVRLAIWAAGLMLPRGGREGEDRYEGTDAESHVRANIGDAAAEYVFRPAVEAAGYFELKEFSAAVFRRWVRATAGAKFFVPGDGMEEPWRRIGRELDVRAEVEVTRVAPALVEPFGEVEAAVVSVPAPIAARLVDPGTPGRPFWLDRVRYSSYVFAYGARRCSEPSSVSQLYPAGPGEHRVVRVSLFSSGGLHRNRIPPGWQGATVAASGPWSVELLNGYPEDDPELLKVLWEEGRKVDDRLFPLEEAEVTWVQRHLHAVPIFEPGHATRLRDWAPRPPVALAGDWASDPSIEGAVRSGERAADSILQSN